MKWSRIIHCLLSLILLMVSAAAVAQPFANDIAAFRKQDSLQMPPRNANLFIGSSSFTLWKDVQKDFAGHTIINRGFGGSTLLDQIRYVNDVVFPYQPKQIVMYCGENDLASSDTVNGQTVFNRFKELFGLIRKKLPNVPFVYVSMKPSPSRVALFTKMQEGNRLINEFLKKQKKATFIDVYSQMLDAKGQPMAEIFREDMLHMNAKGYAIWKRLIEPHLL